MRPREKQMFVIPACFISCFPLLFFVTCYWKSWNEQKPTVITFNTLLLFYILLGRYISACQTNRHYFYKMNRLLYTDSHWCQFLMHPVYWDIYCTMVITFCLKRIKITRSVFCRSQRGCYLMWAKFWQRNCKAKQRMERRRLEYSCTFCIRFLQQSQNTCIHKNNSSSYAGYLIRGFIYWYLTEELKFIPNGG